MKRQKALAPNVPATAPSPPRPLLVRLLSLYPASWRERYGEELSELLASERATPLALAMVLRGALDAHLHPHLPIPGKVSIPGERLRLAALSVFGASIGAEVAVGLFLDKANDLSFPALMQTHPWLQRPWLLLLFGAIVAGLSLLAGGLPIVLAVVQDAYRRRSAMVRLLAVPPLALLLFLGSVALAKDGSFGSWPGGIHLTVDVLFHSLFVLAATVSTGAICLMILHSQITDRLFRWALAPAVCGTIGLVVMLAAAVLWLMGARNVAPADFAKSLITLDFVLLIGLMLVTTLCAARGVLWGLATARRST